MEQPVTSSSLSFTDIPSSINELLPIQDTMVPPSLPSTEIKRSQSMNHLIRFPHKLYLTKRQPHTPQQNADQSHRNHLDSKRRIVPFVFSQIKAKDNLPIRISYADNRLKEIIQHLNPNPVEEDVSEKGKISVTVCSKWIRQSRRFLRHMMERSKFHYVIIALVMIDLIVVLIELVLAHLSMACLTEEEMEQYHTTKQRKECFLPPTHPVEKGELSLYYISLIIICIFTLEILTACYAFGWRRYTKIIYLVDAIIVFASFILEVYFHFGSYNKTGRASAGLVVLRLWKIVRAIHAVAHSISLKNLMVIKEIEKARTILHEENLQAEKTIREQEIKINNLMNLPGKTNRYTTSEQINEFTPRSAKNFNSVTFF